MHNLLRAIKHRIGFDEGLKTRTALNAFRGESRVWIVAENEEAPVSVEPPFIELHPAGEAITNQAAGQQQIIRVVILRLFQSINRRDVGISSETHKVHTSSSLFPSVTTFPGSTGNTRPGVLEIASELVKLLDEFRFDRDGLKYDFAQVMSTSPPTLVAEDDASSLVSVDITIQYTLWRNVGELV